MKLECIIIIPFPNPGHLCPKKDKNGIVGMKIQLCKFNIHFVANHSLTCLLLSLSLLGIVSLSFLLSDGFLINCINACYTFNLNIIALCEHRYFHHRATKLFMVLGHKPQGTTCISLI